MTDRRERLPEEYRNLQPEEFVDIYETEDGRLISPTPTHIAHLIDGGQYDYAYAMMRYHLQTEAMKVLRAEGCAFRRYERLWLADIDGAASDGPEGLAALLADASEFIAENGTTTPKGAAAAESLMALQWQASAIAEADTELGRESLRRMALVSASLGFQTAQAGVTGAIPELESLRRRATAQAKPLSKANTDRSAEADELWRNDLRAFTSEHLTKACLSAPYLGLNADILKSYRCAAPEKALNLPPSDLPLRMIGRWAREWFAEPDGEPG